MESLEKKIFRDLLAAGHEIEIAGLVYGRRKPVTFGKFWTDTVASHIPPGK